jgi:hypothetical protein
MNHPMQSQAAPLQAGVPFQATVAVRYGCGHDGQIRSSAYMRVMLSPRTLVAYVDYLRTVPCTRCSAAHPQA